MQRVRRAERKAKRRSGDYGFQLRRRLVRFGPILKALYPLGPADWPSPATVEVEVLSGRFPLRRPVTLSFRVKTCHSEAEAKRRAVSKLRLSEGESYRLLRVGPVKPDGIKPLGALLYRDAPLFGMLKKREVAG